MRLLNSLALSKKITFATQDMTFYSVSTIKIVNKANFSQRLDKDLGNMIKCDNGVFLISSMAQRVINY